MQFFSYFVTRVVDEWGTTTYRMTYMGMYAIVTTIVILLLASSIFFGWRKRFEVIQLAFSSMTVSLAYIVSVIRLYRFPMGGSVTLFSMLVLSLIGYWYGLGAGILTGICYGLLQMLLDPYLMTPAQVVTDYVLAFGALGISGFFAGPSRHNLTQAYIAAVCGRYFFSILSGCLFFSQYAEAAGYSSPLCYSIVYNGTYLGAEALIGVLLIQIPIVKKALYFLERHAKE